MEQCGDVFLRERRAEGKGRQWEEPDYREESGCEEESGYGRSPMLAESNLQTLAFTG